MSGLWNKGYDVLCLIARTLYNLLRHEKNITKKLRKSLEVMFYSTTFAPAFERERRYKMMKQTFRKKSSEIIWRFKIKVLIFAATFAKRKRQKSSLRDLHNSTSSTSIRKINFPDWYRQRSMTLDYNNGFRSEDIKQFKQRRVWSWLRMNASDRLNTCKSRGSTGSNTGWRPAHGWVTRMQLTYQRGITRRKSD